MELTKLKPLKNQEVKVTYLTWGEPGEKQGVLNKINRSSIIIDGCLIKNKALEIKAVKIFDVWFFPAENNEVI